MPHLRLALVIGVTVSAAMMLAVAPATADGGLMRISAPAPGLEGEADGDSHAHALSGDGRYVAFASDASNLVPDDTNGREDVFVRDQLSGTVKRVSLAVDGRQVLVDSSRPAITDDGRYVAFASRASKLVAGDTNRHEDVFVRDLQAGTTARVSVGAGGIEANGDSRGLAMSPDGRYVAFTSGASNLASRDTNRRGDVFLRDLQAGTTTRVSLRTDGGQGDEDASPLGEVAVSADGRYVAFESDASTFTGSKERGDRGVFVRDVPLGRTTRVDVPVTQRELGSFSDLSGMSANGRYVTFSSRDSNLVAGDQSADNDVFVRDLESNTTRQVSVAANGREVDGESDQSAISADGRYVAFRSDASDLVSCDTNEAGDIFLRDLQANTTARVSVAGDGTQANRDSFGPTISADGQHVAFNSDATNLAPVDSGFHDDAFVTELPVGGVTPTPAATSTTCPARPRPPVLSARVETDPTTDLGSVLRQGFAVLIECNVECTKTAAVTIPRVLAVLLKVPVTKGRGPVTRSLGTFPDRDRTDLFFLDFPQRVRKQLMTAKSLEFTFIVVATAGGTTVRVTKTVVFR